VMTCNSNEKIYIKENVSKSGGFYLSFKNKIYKLNLMDKSTEIFRLENADYVWLQMTYQSMWLSKVDGRRLASECRGDLQNSLFEKLQKIPTGSLLDGSKND